MFLMDSVILQRILQQDLDLQLQLSDSGTPVHELRVAVAAPDHQAEDNEAYQKTMMIRWKALRLIRTTWQLFPYMQLQC